MWLRTTCGGRIRTVDIGGEPVFQGMIRVDGFDIGEFVGPAQHGLAIFRIDPSFQ